MPLARLLVVFGGRSSEHEISVRSATELLAAVDRRRYEPVLLAVARDGRWYTADPSTPPTDVHSRGTPVHDIRALAANVVFPVLHGPYGEDGCFQGLLETFDLPYVGSGVLASALCMDKSLHKRVMVHTHGLACAPWVDVEPHHVDKDHRITRGIRHDIASTCGFPCFVKPANMGSSVGISLVATDADLDHAVEQALRFDDRIVVEKAIDAREIEVAVLGDADKMVVSAPGEIELPAGTWYDYEAKYVNDSAQLRIPAQLPAETVQTVRDLAGQAFRASGCHGLARVDFLVERQSLKAYLNEVNTMPGFTTISMYPKLMGHAGIPYTELISRLCDLALLRHERRQKLSSEIR